MLEVLGKPPEYIETTIEKIVEEIGKQEEVKLIRKNLADAKPLKDNSNLFTSFTEIEIETNLIKLMALIFNFMPSHVEILEPENLEIKNFDMNLVCNELVRRLHQYDEIAKSVLIERQILAEKIKKGELKAEDVQLEKKTKKSKKKKL